MKRKNKTKSKKQRKGNHHQIKMLLIIKQILFISTLGNLWRTATENGNSNVRVEGENEKKENVAD